MPKIALIEYAKTPKIALIECYFFQRYTRVSILYLSYNLDHLLHSTDLFKCYLWQNYTTVNNTDLYLSYFDISYVFLGHYDSVQRGLTVRLFLTFIIFLVWVVLQNSLPISKFQNSDFWKLLRPPLTQFSKFNNFLWVYWFLGKNLSNFVPPVWKLHNPYCHTK
jgi:hypothetical protein